MLIAAHFLLIGSCKKMNFNNMKVPNVGGAASALIKIGLVAGLGIYGVSNSLYNVEGGHRAIVFNRIVGVKEKVVLIYFGILYNAPFFLHMLLYLICISISFRSFNVSFFISSFLSLIVENACLFPLDFSIFFSKNMFC